MRDIGEWLRSEESGETFRHCVRCRMPLLELDCPWLVNKEFVRGECVLEYAICQTCRDAIAAGFSQESRRSVRDFLRSKIDWDGRLREFLLAGELTRRFDSCIACRTARPECSAFGISALFDERGTLTVGPLPLMICQPCIGRMTAGLSAASRGVWRRFIETHFAGPPDGEDRQLPGSGFPGML
jgi:hypothetical protein